jgi:hypothetical protein
MAGAKKVKGGGGEPDFGHAGADVTSWQADGQCINSARWDLCWGVRGNRHSYRDWQEEVSRGSSNR